ncbi:MAG: hypothetical protein K6E35_07815 [Bacteroidales bacterium]|nr:hypothetical protein [Bacteroidales bacterium]
MKQTTTPASKLGAKLANNKMVQVVARLFKKEDFTLAEDGTLELSEEEESQIAATYGSNFLSKLKSLNFSEASSKEATDLFDAAVAAKAAELTADKDNLISQMRSEIERLCADPEPAPAASGANISTNVASAMKQIALNMAAKHNALASRILASDNPYDLRMLDDATIDVSDLNQEFSMAMPPKVKLEMLLKKMYVGFDDAKHMTRIQSNTDYIGSAAEMSEVSQQFTPKWTPKGSAKFTPLRIQQRRHKLNVLIRPTEVLKSWLLWLYEQGKTQAEMPIVRYIVQEHILPRLLQDITMSMIAKGKFIETPWNSVSDGDNGTPAKNSMDGFETILVEGKTNPNIKFNYYRNAADPRNMTDAQVYAYVDAFVRSLSGLFVSLPVVHCSQEVVDAYVRGDFAQNGKYTGEIYKNGEVRFSTVHLVPLKSMYGSPILFATPKSNFIELVDYSKAENCINKIEEFNYDVKIFGEYSLATGFKIQEAVFAAVPDGYTPVSAVNSDAEADTTVWQLGGVAPVTPGAEGGTGTEGAGTEGAGTEGAGTEGAGTEGTGTEGAGTEGGGNEGGGSVEEGA